MAAASFTDGGVEKSGVASSHDRQLRFMTPPCSAAPERLVKGWDR